MLFLARRTPAAESRAPHSANAFRHSPLRNECTAYGCECNSSPNYKPVAMQDNPHFYARHRRTVRKLPSRAVFTGNVVIEIIRCVWIFWLIGICCDL